MKPMAPVIIDIGCINFAKTILSHALPSPTHEVLLREALGESHICLNNMMMVP